MLHFAFEKIGYRLYIIHQMTSNKKIVFGLTGSVACFKACNVISTLVTKGIQVQVIATKSTFEFVGKATFEGLTGRKILSDMYEDGHQMKHINILKDIDLFVIAPATCNIINKLANGICDNLLVSSFIANNFKKPTLIYPAMNTGMLEYPTTQKSLKFLKEKGTIIELGEEGVLACGTYGLGRLSDPDKIIDSIMKFL